MSKTRRNNPRRSYLPLAARQRPAYYDPDTRGELLDEAFREDMQEELEEELDIDEDILKKIRW